MAAADRFTDLSDGLLASVISFLPTKDAACTAVLSRRWRPLWLSTDVLNLDSRSYGGGLSDLHYRPYSSSSDASRLKDRLFSDAGAALRATGRRPVRKLSLLVAGPNDAYCHDVMSASTWSVGMRDWDEKPYDLLVALLAVPELGRIEELRLGFHHNNKKQWRSFIYQLDAAVLPGSTLRVLDLAYTRITLPRRRGAVLLPRLSVLRLYKCSSSMKGLQDFIHAAPSLGSLHIHGLDFYSYRDTSDDSFSLHCPSATTVTLASLGFRTDKGIELDAPCLRNFKYDGGLIDFSMKSPAPELARAELALTPRPYRHNETEKPWFGAFWRINSYATFNTPRSSN
ncbi:hypothetical protein ZWY2020_010112 [Hordeum vulgare]|nr:hypothetical protein ZWY2020_010112 [Hordeum vulgare]